MYLKYNIFTILILKIKKILVVKIGGYPNKKRNCQHHSLKPKKKKKGNKKINMITFSYLFMFCHTYTMTNISIESRPLSGLILLIQCDNLLLLFQAYRGLMVLF